MGGYGAFKLALRHPERYAAAASLSGALDIADLDQRRSRAQAHEKRWIFGDLKQVPGSDNELLALAKRQPLPRVPNPCSTSGAAPKTSSTPTTWPSATMPTTWAWT